MCIKKGCFEVHLSFKHDVRVCGLYLASKSNKFFTVGRDSMLRRKCEEGLGLERV